MSVITENRQSIISVIYNREFDLVNKCECVNCDIKVNADIIRQGLIKELGATNFSVLMAIASYMNERGECYPTQKQLAELTGLTVATVNKSIKSLLDCKVGGKPILERELLTEGIKKNSFYNFTKVNEKVPVVIDGVPAEKTAKDYAMLFCEEYEKKYGYTYTLSYSKDYSLIKSKLMSQYTDEQIQSIIKNAIAHYDKRWKNINYPTPTISMICTWLANYALQIEQEDKQQEQAINELTAYTGITLEQLESLETP